MSDEIDDGYEQIVLNNQALLDAILALDSTRGLVLGPVHLVVMLYGKYIVTDIANTIDNLCWGYEIRSHWIWDKFMNILISVPGRMDKHARFRRKRDDVIAQYSSGSSIFQLQQCYGVSGAFVTNRLKEWDVEIRPLSAEEVKRRAELSGRSCIPALRRLIHDAKTFCVLCGNTNSDVLGFHHRGDEQKTCNISTMVRKDMRVDRLHEEIEKCEILCFNCHHLVHLAKNKDLLDKLTDPNWKSYRQRRLIAGVGYGRMITCPIFNYTPIPQSECAYTPCGYYTGDIPVAGTPRDCRWPKVDDIWWKV